MKNLLFALAILFSANQVNSQSHWGFKGGWALSNLTTNNGEIDDSNSRNGFTVGVYANYPFLGILSFQPELLYTQKGGEVRNLNTTIDTKSGYVELPLNVQLNILNAFYIYAGPQVSYLTSIDVDYKLGSVIVATDRDVSDYNRIDIGGNYGLGWQNDRLTFDARVSKGYINYDDREITDIVDQSRNLTNFTFALTAGIKF